MAVDVTEAQLAAVAGKSSPEEFAAMCKRAEKAAAERLFWFMASRRASESK